MRSLLKFLGLVAPDSTLREPVASDTKHQRPGVGRRLIITGSSGSGKSVLAQRVSVVLGLPHTELDLIVLDNKGQRKPSDETSQVLEAVVPLEGWILEGAPWDVPERAWGTASTVLLLELPRFRRAWWQFRREFPRRLLRPRVEVHGWTWWRTLGGIRHTLTAAHIERERRRRYVREKTPATVQLIEISSVRDIRAFIRDVGAA